MSGIRLGDIPDIDQICDLAKELLEQSIYADIEPDRSKFRLLVANMCGDKTSRVMVIVDDENNLQGFLLGMVEELFFSRRRYGTDLCMYVREGFRHLAPSMIRQFIHWAKSKPRVDLVLFGISSGFGDPERTGKLYASLGFANVGGIYAKNL